MDDGTRLFLNVEDDAFDSEYIEGYLRDAGFTFRFSRVETRSQFLDALETTKPDIILCDLNLPLFSGMEALSLARLKAPEIPLIFISGTMGESLAVDCLQKGATDYILKGDMARLAPAVRRALEEADLQRAKVQADREMIHHEKLAMIGQLSAGIAHEINNPLTYVNLNLESLVEYADTLQEVIRRCRALCLPRQDGGSDAALEEVGRMLEDPDVLWAVEDLPKLGRETLVGGQRVTEIVQGLRGFSRNDWNEPEDVDVSECMESAFRIGWNEIKHKCEVRKRLTTPGPHVRGRPGQLVQVFLNLLMNASQAIPAHGRLDVEVVEEDGFAVARVRDDGEGIQPGNLGRLFTPFFTTKAPGTGTGMGLFISHGIVKSHGGEIRVSSQPGKGSEFTVVIPLGVDATPV